MNHRWRDPADRIKTEALASAALSAWLNPPCECGETALECRACGRAATLAALDLANGNAAVARERWQDGWDACRDGALASQWFAGWVTGILLHCVWAAIMAGDISVGGCLQIDGSWVLGRLDPGWEP